MTDQFSRYPTPFRQVYRALDAAWEWIRRLLAEDQP